MQGEGMGSCASGFGTCCVFIYNGDDKDNEEVLTKKISYIENPSSPTRSMSRNLEVKATNEGDICLEKLLKSIH